MVLEPWLCSLASLCAEYRVPGSLLNPGQELGVEGHQVLEAAVDGTILDHPDLAVPLQNGGFDLTDLFRQQILPVFVIVKNQGPGFLDAFGDTVNQSGAETPRAVWFSPKTSAAACPTT